MKPQVKIYMRLVKNLTKKQKFNLIWWSKFNTKKFKRFHECLQAGINSKTAYKKAKIMESILMPIRKLEVKIDDTTTFGCSHHEHFKHRVYIDGLSHEEAIMLRKFITNNLYGRFS